MSDSIKSPVDRLQNKYRSADQHLNAITDAIVEQFEVHADQRNQVRKAVEAAYHVGRRTTTTDDWCDE